MQTRSSNNSTTTILIVLIVILTFPVWIGILGGIFGIIMGVFGTVIGVVAGGIGALIGAIGGIIGWMFHCHLPLGFEGYKFFTVAFVVLIIVLLSKSKR